MLHRIGERVDDLDCQRPPFTGAQFGGEFGYRLSREEQFGVLGGEEGECVGGTERDTLSYELNLLAAFYSPRKVSSTFREVSFSHSTTAAAWSISAYSLLYARTTMSR